MSRARAKVRAAPMRAVTNFVPVGLTRRGNADLTLLEVTIFTGVTHQIRAQLANVLVGVVSQTLLPLKNGTGRIAAMEILNVTDAVAAMIREAEQYLGFPYVWGGSSPQTSFDCSGFVSWVLNHSGWSVGRPTAEGLRTLCAPVGAAQAQPGDLIFFENTYNTPGASHVGIYVGDGMMIHCGDPIQYASIETPYWQDHFLSFGRLPDPS